MTDKLTTLQSLRDRVAQATGLDKSLSTDFAIAFDVCDPDMWVLTYYDPLVSVDAALTWVERVLPGYAWAVTAKPDKFAASVWARSPISRGLPGTKLFHAPCPALAIIMAGLDALIEKEKADDQA